jgi:hypothetical protein
MNLLGIFQNQKSVAIRKFVQDLLGDKYNPYDDFLDRIAYHLVTENDITTFGKMISDIYRQGYMKAVGDYKDQLDKYGIEVKVDKNE